MQPLAAPAVASLCDSLESVSADLAALMRSVSDPAPTAVGIWSIGETCAHVSGSAEYFLAALRGEVAPERLDEVDTSNVKALADFLERDPRRLADRLVAGERALVGHARAIHGDPPAYPFEGVEVPTSTVLGIELGELLVHGFDIARAAGLPWTIDRPAALLTLRAYLPLLPFNVDRVRAEGVHLDLEIRIRGMPAVVVHVANGAVRVTASDGGRVHAHLWADPAAYLLLMWNRVPVWRPLLSGQLLVWGRQPWRASELATLMMT
jgi:uncharacterized protein (TIGR03083 family)